MRFICTLLIGLLALSTVGAAQSLPGGRGRIPSGGISAPHGRGITPGGPTIHPGGPIIVPVPRSCPKGTVGKWPACVDVTHEKPGDASPPAARILGKTCPEGQVRKRKRCVEVTHGRREVRPAARFRDKTCPAGQVRKRSKCVEVTHGSPGNVTPPAPAAPKRTQAEPIPSPTPPIPTRKQAEPIPPTIAALTAGRPHQPAEVLVLVNASRADEIGARLAQQYNLTGDPPVPLVLLDNALVRFRFEGARSLESVLAALSADPDVDLAQPNYDYQVSKGPVLPKNVPQYAVKTIRLEEAHHLARGRGVTIAVIDTAIEADHPELVDTITDVFDAVGEGKSKPELHGTEIAGILCSHAKLMGAAPESKLLSVRAFSDGGKAGLAHSTSLRLLKGIDWAFGDGAKVMNMSFTGPLDPLLERMVTAAAEKGVILVAAAGNEGPKAPPVYPAAYPQVIAVTATDEKDRPYEKANHGSYINIGAPGVDIVAPALKGSYGLSSGTSMAAAHVSGVVALLLERDPNLSATQVRTILASSARKPPKPFGEEAIGAGILDAASAVGQGGEIETGEDASPEAGASAGPEASGPAQPK